MTKLRPEISCHDACSRRATTRKLQAGQHALTVPVTASRPAGNASPPSHRER
ncbi:hypothetical protein C8T65DRAFT_657161 [Cerioporus squamosus]|nr:hypothetical protein C8T65DRAFT_657161 [Cerioporus squamosus]